MHWESKKFMWFTLLRYLLYWGSLELKPLSLSELCVYCTLAVNRHQHQETQTSPRSTSPHRSLRKTGHQWVSELIASHNRSNGSLNPCCGSVPRLGMHIWTKHTQQLAESRAARDQLGSFELLRKRGNKPTRPLEGTALCLSAVHYPLRAQPCKTDINRGKLVVCKCLPPREKIVPNAMSLLPYKTLMLFIKFSNLITACFLSFTDFFLPLSSFESSLSSHWLLH